MKNNSVTIAIPVYERTEFLRESINSAIRQTTYCEVLVVDNCSPSTQIQKIAESYGSRLQYYRNETNLGMVGNWNKCFQLSDSKWVSILHDDDILYPTAIEDLLKASTVIKECSLYFGLESACDDNGRIIIDKTSAASGQIKVVPLKSIASKNIFCAPGFIVDKEKAQEIGGFNDKYSMTADWDLWFRLHLLSGIVKVEKVLSCYRVYSGPRRGTSIQERNGRMLPRIMAQQKRNIHRQRQDIDDSTLIVNRIQVAQIAQGLLSRKYYLLSPFARRLYRKYASTSFPNGKINNALFCLSPEFFAWFCCVKGMLRTWSRSTTS